jgi:hypothetical protein
MGIYGTTLSSRKFEKMTEPCPDASNSLSGCENVLRLAFYLLISLDWTWPDNLLISCWASGLSTTSAWPEEILSINRLPYNWLPPQFSMKSLTTNRPQVGIFTSNRANGISGSLEYSNARTSLAIRYRRFVSETINWMTNQGPRSIYGTWTV